MSLWIERIVWFIAGFCVAGALASFLEAAWIAK
jgi:hypothetical protein